MEIFKVFGSIFLKDEATKGIQDAEKKAKSFSKTMENVGKGMQNVGKKMSLFVTTPLIGLATGMGKAAMDLEATGAKYETVFEGMTDEADAFLTKFKQLTPATKAEARSMASGIQDLLVPMGFMRDEATNMTGEMMHVIGALTNFNSGTHDAERVTAAMQSALLGSYQSLQSLGIQLDVTTVKQKAVEQGMASNTDEVTKQMMAQIMIQEVYAQSGDALAAYTEENLDAQTKMGLMKTEIIDVAASFGEHLLPIINKAIDILRTISDGFGALTSEQQKTIIIIGAVVAGIGPLLIVIGKILKLLPLLKTGFIFLTGPIGFVIGAIALLTAGILYLWKTNETFREIVLAVWDKIKIFIVSSIKFISYIIQTVTGYILQLWDLWGKDITNIAKKSFELIMVIVEIVMNEIKKVIVSSIKFISYIIQTVTGYILQLWDLWGKDITNIAKKSFELIMVIVEIVMNEIKKVIEDVTNVIMWIWGKFGDYILAHISLIFDMVMTVVKVAFDTIKNTISQVLKIINGIFDVFIGILTGDWSRMWDGMVAVGKGASNLIIGIFNGVISAAEGMVNAVGKAINSIPTFKVPDWVPVIGGGNFRLPKMPSLNIPRIPKLDVGTNMVKSDGLALLHAGEAVVPKKYNPAAGGSAGGVTINITGNTIMNDRDADRFGDVIVNRLRTLGVVT